MSLPTHALRRLGVVVRCWRCAAEDMPPKIVYPSREAARQAAFEWVDSPKHADVVYLHPCQGNHPGAWHLTNAPQSPECTVRRRRGVDHVR